MMEKTVVVSIVIVCMNNLKNLYPCLDSVKKHTSVPHEIIVVAYLFSKDKLDQLRNDYSSITIIESNEIRGFSENNNLALRQVKGKYCFVLNDDTEMKMSVIDKLVKTIESLPENVAIVSPVTTYPDGRVQICGRPPKNWMKFLLQTFHLWDENKGIYVNKTGVFKSYNIVGAAFLIKTDVFRQFGWFDETYFFCPEDIALSTLLNRNGYYCYVNSDIEIIHYEGMSSKSLSMVQVATRPSACKGSIIFYADGSIIKKMSLSFVLFFVYCFRFLIHRLVGMVKKSPNTDYILSIGDLNCIQTCFSKKSPKEIFKKYYLKNAK